MGEVMWVGGGKDVLFGVLSFGVYIELKWVYLFTKLPYLLLQRLKILHQQRILLHPGSSY